VSFMSLGLFGSFGFSRMCSQSDHPLAPWYVAGLAFECSQCGRCCAGPEEGYVWLTEAEIIAIASHLGMDPVEVRKRYVRKAEGRYSLREVPRSHDCVFLTADQGNGRGCRIYPVRPAQCRTWPFWDANLQDPTSWTLANLRCKGINRGRRFSFEEIELRRRATHAR